MKDLVTNHEHHVFWRWCSLIFLHAFNFSFSYLNDPQINASSPCWILSNITGIESREKFQQSDLS